MRRATVLVVFALAAAACGSGQGTGTTTTTSSADTTTTIAPATTTTTAPVDSTTTTVATTTTTAPPPATTTTTVPAATTSTTPGRPVDFGPSDGDILMVTGVGHDDVLNLRAGPGVDQRIRAEIPPTYDDLVAMGNTRELPSSFWVQVDYDGTAGWVNLRYVGYGGDTTDETSTVVSSLGETPVEPSMAALAKVVADEFASTAPKSDVVQVTPVVGGDLTEVTYDVIGLGDDAVGGVRLHIFAEKAGGRYALRSVEVTPICSRGVDDGACV